MASIIYWHVLKHPVLDLVIRRYPKSHCDKSSKAITLLKLHFFENQLKLLAKIIDIFTCTDLKTQNWVKISYIWPSHIMIDLWRPLSHFEFLRPRAYCAVYEIVQKKPYTVQNYTIQNYTVRDYGLLIGVPKKCYTVQNFTNKVSQRKNNTSANSTLFKTTLCEGLL